MSSKLIGITGKAGTGKDTCARALVQQGYEPIAFATPIKAALQAMISELSHSHMHGDKKELPLDVFPNGITPRHLAQTLGTEWGREAVHPDIWVLLAMPKIKAFMEAGTNVVITDVRFENEAAMIRKLGGTVVHILRDSSIKSDHKSEAGVLQHHMDKRIYNVSTIHELHHSILEIGNKI